MASPARPPRDEAYLDRHRVREVITAAINSVMSSKPADPLSAIAGQVADEAGRRLGITAVLAREVLDATAAPTVRCDVTTPLGTCVWEEGWQGRRVDACTWMTCAGVFVGIAGGVKANGGWHKPHTWDGDVR